MRPTPYPLAWPAGWKRETAHHRKTGRFRSGGSSGITISRACDRILDELRKFGVRDWQITISTNVEPKLSGLPASSGPKPLDPGVAVYWRDGDNYRVIAIDIYLRVEDNLAAVAACLDGMRAIERHGGSMILERAFAGFLALPAPGTTSRSWRDVLDYGDGPAVSALIDRSYRALAASAHPDRGGSHDAMSELNAARAEALKESQS